MSRRIYVEVVRTFYRVTVFRNFPVAKLQKLDELISNPRWVIPVLPKAELETLLDYSIELSRAGIDTKSDHCQKFYRDGLLTSFAKIMMDEAVTTWRFDIHKCILRNCEKLIELCVVKLHDDYFPLLDLLAMVLNPTNRFHLYNASRPSEFKLPLPASTSPSTSASPAQNHEEPAEPTQPEPYARSVDSRNPRGWLVDLLNRFGCYGGFERLSERFKPDNMATLSVPLIYSLVRPFGQCYDMLTPSAVKKFLLPIVEAVPKFLDNLNDEELKKEAKNEAKNDSVSSIIKSLKCLASTVSGQEENVRQVEMFRLKMILRQLQISSFSGKMNALNEVNRVITSISYYHQQGTTRTVMSFTLILPEYAFSFRDWIFPRATCSIA